MPAKGQGCIRVREASAGDRPSPTGESPVSVIGAGIAGAWQALLFAQAGHDVTLHERSDADDDAIDQPLGRRHAGALVRGRGLRARDRPARHPLARSVARAFSANPVQRLAGGGASARPRRFRTFCQADLRPPAARRRGHDRTRTVAGGPFPRRPVLCRRRPCRAAAGAAASCMRASIAAGGTHQIQQRRQRRTTSTAS